MNKRGRGLEGAMREVMVRVEEEGKEGEDRGERGKRGEKRAKIRRK